MPSPDVFALRRSRLNDFLFTAVGTEANGMTLSVVSVFARLGNDPWLEASRLARLPRSEATESLARSIAGMPTSPWPLEVAIEIAKGLIPLLPTHIGSPESGPPAALEYRGKLHRVLKIAVVLVCIACMLAFEAGVLPTFEALELNFRNIAG
jgi:hypothetical protein